MNHILSLRAISAMVLVAFAALLVISLYSCKTSQAVAAKSGAQLWAENCQRCHNTPSPSTFSAEQWRTIGMHMQTRSLITQDEKEKIIAFLTQ